MRCKSVVIHCVLTAVFVAAGAGVAFAQPPQIQLLTPNQGSSAGGTLVTFNGNNFNGTTAVTFGGVNAESFQVITNNELRAVTPPHEVDTVNVSVTNASGTTTAASAFRYLQEPVTVDDAYQTQVSTPLVVPAPGVLNNDNKGDGENLTASIWTGPSHGGVVINSDGGFTYTPVSGYAGPDSFTYRASTTLGLGSRVGTVSITVAGIPTPQSPSALTVWSLINGIVTLRWQPPTTGLAPEQYSVACGANPGETLQVLTTSDASSTALSFSVPGGLFHCRAFSRAAGQQSGASNEVRVANTGALPPSTPDSLSAVVSGTTVALSWRQTSDGGLPGSAVIDVSGTLNASLPLGPGETASFAGVPAGTFTLTLRSTNGAGSSGPSNAVTITVPSACAGPPPAPNVFVYKSGNTIFVAWGPSPGGSPAATSYLLNVSGAFNGSIPTTSRTLSGAVGAGSYTFTVVASNVCGSSAPSAPQTINIP